MLVFCSNPIYLDLLFNNIKHVFEDKQENAEQHNVFAEIEQIH